MILTEQVYVVLLTLFVWTIPEVVKAVLRRSRCCRSSHTTEYIRLARGIYILSGYSGSLSGTLDGASSLRELEYIGAGLAYCPSSSRSDSHNQAHVAGMCCFSGCWVACTL